MYPQGRMVRQVLKLGLLVTLVVLALSACEANEWQQESKSRPLPEGEKALRPGECYSEEFKPSFSFRVAEGWTKRKPESSDALQIAWGENAGLDFTNVQEVYKPGTLSRIRHCE
jgi:hypothetical protein